MLSINRLSQIAITLTCFVATLLLSIPNANARVYSLGDSLSDAGALGFTYTNPVKLSPLLEGNVWVQYITNSIPAFCNEPSHCKFDKDTFYYTGTGNNYAVGGAGVTFDSTDANLEKNFTSLHFQVEALIHNRKLTKDDVITIWMGANDIFAATADPATSVSTVTRAARQFRSEVNKLAKFGARIYVITIPDLGQTPLGQFLPASDAQFLSDLSGVFNNGISALSNVKNVSLIDSNAFFDTLKTSREFDSSASYCPFIIDPANICGDANNPVTNSSEEPFIFADPIHPSNATHRWIGETMKKLIH